MDRLNKVHRASRVELPKSVVNFEQAKTSPDKQPWLTPTASYFLGIIGFMTCGAAVIAAASFVALSIQ